MWRGNQRRKQLTLLCPNSLARRHHPRPRCRSCDIRHLLSLDLPSTPEDLRAVLGLLFALGRSSSDDHQQIQYVPPTCPGGPDDGRASPHLRPFYATDRSTVSCPMLGQPPVSLLTPRLDTLWRPRQSGAGLVTSSARTQSRSFPPPRISQHRAHRAEAYTKAWKRRKYQ